MPMALTRRKHKGEKSHDEKSHDDAGDGGASGKGSNGKDSNGVSPSDAKRFADAIDASITAPTHEFHWWEQVPAWLLGLISVGFAVLLVLRKSDDENAWAFAIVALFVSVLLSYRSAFTIGAPPEGDTGDDTGDADTEDGGT